ncbi:DUF2384 domain-containing protein [bacterium]|nr:DUF2384 domain-containing protein [bacterium]
MTTLGRPSSKIGLVGLKAFFRIADLWDLSVKQQMLLLGLDSQSTFYNWKNDPSSARLDRDKTERLSLVLGIYKDLQVLLPNNTSADLWLTRPNEDSMFGGRPPIEFVSSGQITDMFLLRQHLSRAVSR